MASFPVGKFTAAAVNATATASSTVALANFNLDFSFYKVVQPPKEFSDVGNALSPTRRQEAECGKVHKTARQLSALFEPLLPPTPELEKAYGLRASEIAKAYTAKEGDQKKYGVFAARAGADSTSIWAAATSGGGAIKVHLLACMLARLWEWSEAISIWVEIVAERKKQIVAVFEATGSIDLAAHQATIDDLERYRLAEWDASARAWLRTADLRKARQQTQLELVIRNLQIPVNCKPVLYESVLQAWKVALVGMEHLLQGVPQSVQSGELVLALSAWHLYPDMIVLSSSTAVIEQKDPLFAGGVLTFGLSGNTSNAQSGVHWSLPLAYLRYYGDPVIRVRAMTEDRPRSTVDELGKVVLGCVIGGWGSDGENTIDASQFIIDLSDKLSDSLFKDRQKPQAISEYHNSALAILATAASDLLSSQGAERRRSLELIRLGKRRVDFIHSPFAPHHGFGISHIGYCLELQTSFEGRIEALRNLVKYYREESEDLLIRYTRRLPGTALIVHEYATALPYSREALKRTTGGVEKTSHGHCRWIVTQHKTALNTLKVTEYFTKSDPRLNRAMYPTETDGEEDEHEGGKEDNREYPARAEEQDVDTATTEFSEDQFQKQLLDYKETVGCRGELVLAVEDEGIYRAYKDNKEVIYWKQSEVLVEMIDLTEEAPTLGGSMCHRQVEAAHPHTRFEMVCGDDHAALFTASREQLSQRSHWLPHTVELSQIHRSLLNETLDSARFLRACSKAFDSLEFRYAHSLQCFATVVQMYKLMPDASIDTRVLDKPLSAAPWVKSASISKYNESSSLLQNFSLDRAEAFSCIVMFESGQYEINPDSLSNVMAVSSGDSIFVAAPLLCDPSEKPLEQEIRRVLGNVGRPGIVLLVPPEAPRIRSPDTRDWNLINLDDYDGGEQDCFSNTSLHLSFTGASFPIDVGYFGGQDTEVYMLETLVSVHDKGHWVADLDVLKGMEDKSLHRYTGCVNGKHVKQAKGEKVVTPLGFTSIQSWEDFLERPRERGIVQAYQNWQARLAVTSVSLAQKHNTLVLPDDFCWLCDYQDLLKATSGKYGSTIIH